MNLTRIEIAPSILSADFSCLEREVKAVEDAGADRLHCDVMDGHFVPNITFGPLVVEAVRKCVTIPLDVHLMISQPERYVDDFCSAGAQTLTVHAEACADLPTVLEKIRKNGVRPGVSVNPDKPLSLFLNHLGLIDQVLIMSVFAGFGGQAFLPECLEKISAVYRETARHDRLIDIEVDGGINEKTAFECAKRGATVFVSGSYIFNHRDYPVRIGSLRTAALRGAALIDRNGET